MTLKREIVKVTGVADAVFTIERGQEGFQAQAFSAGALVEMRMTAGTILGTPEISPEDVLATRQKHAVVNTLPASPAADTIYYILE